MNESMTFHFSKNVEINFEKGGNEGPAVIFLHGFGDSLATWSGIRNAMPKDYQLYFIDLKGCGYSSKPNDGKYSAVDQAEIITAFIDRQGLKRVILVGHSFGGAVALLTYMNFHNNPVNPIEKIVLIDSAGYNQKLPFFIAILRIPVVNSLVLNLLPGEFQAEHTLRNLIYDKSKLTRDKILRYEMFYAMPGSHNALIQTAKQIVPVNHEEIIKKIKLINVPTLIMWGRNDPIIPVENAFKFQADISGAKAKIIDNCGHIPQEEKPEEAIKAIAEFLSGD
jgi:pimeloyl-ACP methyl ester carboxylesterase